MDGVSAAASIIALVEISVKALSLTVEYSTQVKSAQEHISRLTEQNRLAGSFFFSKSRGDLSHAGKLFSTIAIQLAGTSPTLKRYICEAIAENENFSQQSMHSQ